MQRIPGAETNTSTACVTCLITVTQLWGQRKSPHGWTSYHDADIQPTAVGTCCSKYRWDCMCLLADSLLRPVCLSFPPSQPGIRPGLVGFGKAVAEVLFGTEALDFPDNWKKCHRLACDSTSMMRLQRKAMQFLCNP